MSELRGMMISVVRGFTGKSASDGYAGDLTGFLSSLFLEVAAENYRQMLSEKLLTSEYGQLLDPPLRGSESEVTALFASAFSRIAGLTHPEPTLRRAEGTGKLDYLVWYQNRTIALELKAIRINYLTEGVPEKLVNRLSTAIAQAIEAQTHLRALMKSDRRVKSPVALALMLVTGYSSYTPKDESREAEAQRLEEFQRKFVDGMSKRRPQYIATYSVPTELRRVAWRSSGVTDLERPVYIPYYAFLARCRLRANGED